MMIKSTAVRLSIALVLITINLLFLANHLGLVPDESESALKLRKALSESLALQFCAAAEQKKFQIIQNTLRAVVERNDHIRSAAIRTQKGKLVAMAGDHLAHWRPPKEDKSTPEYVQTPVYLKGKKWATVEIRFVPIVNELFKGGFSHSFVGLMVFVALSSLAFYIFIIKRTLRELDPSTVIPERVQKAFNVLKEGVFILDNKEHIIMANQAFSDLLGKTPEAMIGLKGSELGWQYQEKMGGHSKLPWISILQGRAERQDAMLSLISHEGGKIKMVVNAAKVSDDAGRCRGCLVTFDDITQLEEKNFELNDLVTKLELSHAEIKSKSKELEFLANRDPLTLCLNRRSLERMFHALFGKAKKDGLKLSCLMVDIDFFKSVNDRYGHATGDQVIRGVADILKTCTRDEDQVGRYGGEEYCVVLPGLNLEMAAKIAERIRETIEKKPCGGVDITVSIGVSTLQENVNNPDELVDHADKALYLAKKSGRNRVITWGSKQDPSSCSADQNTEEEVVEPEQSQNSGSDSKSVNKNLQRKVQELEALLEQHNLEMAHNKMYDHKTGLPSRKLFEDRITHEIARCKRKESLVVVLSIAIDTIKRVDQALGHNAARQLVLACGRRLTTFLREDVDTVAVVENSNSVVSVSEINHTDFGILLTDIEQVDDVTAVIRRLLDGLKKPFVIKKQEIYCSVHIGVAIYPYDGHNVEKLYASAVNACYHAHRSNGTHNYLFASHIINEKAMAQLNIENYLHEAIEKNELELYYQPQIKTSTCEVVGFEALLRWHSEVLGPVPPNQFIPVAEQSGLIDQIGDWVIEQACRQIRVWLDAGFEVGTVAVNLSGRQLRQKNLATKIRHTLEAYSLSPALLEVELTESSLANTYDKSFTLLKQIKALGVSVSMDDFGTGYSSLAYLKNMPLDRIKIDRAFIKDIGQGENADKLLVSIVTMAHGLGLQVVAEGVEEQHQAEFLNQLRCEYVQGYLFGKPVPIKEATAFLQTRNAA